LGSLFTRAALGRIASSIIGAGIFYFFWLAAFLLTKDIRGGISEAVFWLLAPPVTAAGFTVGIVLFDQIAKASEPRYASTFLWSLIGCVFGAACVYWFGPMLIVFGMFAAGTGSIIIMEAVKSTHSRRA
jgi:hypothetical protein